MSYTALSGRESTSIVGGFMAAIRSSSFVSASKSTRSRWVKTMLGLLENLRADIPAMPTFASLAEPCPHTAEAWEERVHYLDKKKLRYWSGWSVSSAKNETQYLNLPSVWHSHGETLAEELYDHWRKHCSKQSRPNPTIFNRLLAFISANKDEWPPMTFKHPQMLKELFKAFMADFFIKAERCKRKLNSQILAWNQFICHCEEAFIQSGSWTAPYGKGLPRPVQAGGESLSHISTNDQGEEVHEKLITSVPLELTDDQAIEILFRDIKKDINVVVSWATAKAYDVYSRVSNRKRLAESATPLKVTDRLKSLKLVGPARVCATFEANGFPESRATFKQQYGDKSHSGVIAHLLGLPTTGTLEAYQLLLVSEHQEITSSFFLNFELYNKKGHLSGFLNTDGKPQLIGYKDRRGAKLSEQKIDLTPKSAQWVQEIIEITSPLRERLKKDGDDRWRELFLTCGKGMSYPASMKYMKWNRASFSNAKKQYVRLAQEFEALTPERGEDLVNFLCRINPSSLRASCAVNVYLKTKSVSEMSKALGHIRFNAKLLERYLPKAILDFFQSRWVRIFQKGFICEAMKNSKHLLVAAQFDNMAQLHEFLKNHALQGIPEHLSDPENLVKEPQGPAGDSQAYVFISTGVMTALLSLEQAVAHAERPEDICGTAIYWAEFSRTVTAEILRDNDGLLKNHLAEARMHCDASKMEGLIYATAA